MRNRKQRGGNKSTPIEMNIFSSNNSNIDQVRILKSQINELKENLAAVEKEFGELRRILTANQRSFSQINQLKVLTPKTRQLKQELERNIRMILAELNDPETQKVVKEKTKLLQDKEAQLEKLISKEKRVSRPLLR